MRKQNPVTVFHNKKLILTDSHRDGGVTIGNAEQPQDLDDPTITEAA